MTTFWKCLEKHPDPQATTKFACPYCVLPTGHKGDHSICGPDCLYVETHSWPAVEPEFAATEEVA